MAVWQRRDECVGRRMLEMDLPDRRERERERERERVFVSCYR